MDYGFGSTFTDFAFVVEGVGGDSDYDACEFCLIRDGVRVESGGVRAGWCCPSLNGGVAALWAGCCFHAVFSVAGCGNPI